jgi:hypothetical protein
VLGACAAVLWLFAGFFNWLRVLLGQVRERGVGEPMPDQARIVAQARAAAHAFAAGRDGSSLAPPEIRAAIALWQERLHSAGEQLDLEGWLLGLLTLACLYQRDPQVPRPSVLP